MSSVLVPAHALPAFRAAGALQISPHTVRDHVKSLHEKVGVRSRAELVSELYRLQTPPTSPSPTAAERPSGTLLLELRCARALRSRSGPVPTHHRAWS